MADTEGAPQPRHQESVTEGAAVAMNATRKAVALRQYDLIHVEHQHEPGTPCYCEWDTDAIVDGRRLVGGMVAVEWHTENGTTGITVVDPDTNIPYRGHRQAAA